MNAPLVTYCDLTINRVWSVLSLLQQIQNSSHMPSCSLGSYYPRTVESSSPKLNAYKPELGPLLHGLFHVFTHGGGKNGHGLDF